MPTLYQLSQDLAAIHQALLENGGDLTPELEERLKQLDFQTRDKVDAYKAVWESLKAEEEMFREESHRCHAIAVARKKAQLVLQERLRQYMDCHGVTELKGQFHTVKVVKNGGQAEVQVLVPPESLPDPFVTKTANKTYLRALIQEQADDDGIVRWEGIPIAKLGERGTSLRWQ